MGTITKQEAIRRGAATIEAAAARMPNKTQKELADRLRVSTQLLSIWKRRGVPGEECRAVAVRSGGLFTAHDLRADVFGEAPDAGDSLAA